MKSSLCFVHQWTLLTSSEEQDPRQQQYGQGQYGYGPYGPRSYGQGQETQEETENEGFMAKLKGFLGRIKEKVKGSDDTMMVRL